MKRSIIYILSLLVAVAANAADYRMWIDDFEIKAGETMEVSLNMDNTTAVTGFQTDIYLPEGLSIKIDEDDFYYIDLTTRATRGHTIDGSAMSDGAVRVIAYTTDLNPFKLNTGAVATITLVASTDFAGTHTIEVRNTELAAADGKQFYPADETCNVNKQPDTKPGDVNGDGVVDMSDMNIAINVILGKGQFADNPGADVNGDGVVDMSDLNSVINLILGK
ncbi:MAG: dockerin type I domain-containing protein [Muribaculaceae bacterium]|nr:dockerin type I domain-containing protein [Muribaculaceae bacterium]